MTAFIGSLTSQLKTIMLTYVHSFEGSVTKLEKQTWTSHKVWRPPISRKVPKSTSQIYAIWVRQTASAPIFKPRCDVDGVNPRSAKLGHSTVAGDLCLTKKTIASHVTPHFQWKQISSQQPGQVTEWSGYVVPPSLDTMPNPFQPL